MSVFKKDKNISDDINFFCYIILVTKIIVFDKYNYFGCLTAYRHKFFEHIF